ncbi:hypothetical protein [Streptomyces sp. NBC_01190]|uniref:hypothetical protein n=1 Tax=Streptomyces sp. NBC_01190 TaxID=2903767 RepID=UPI003864B06B|nr:hypothetical protein OG519_29145 [Streptomyces sp. NBC_01190]
MQHFVEAWDGYPGWSQCRSASSESTSLTGSFPAHQPKAGLPTHSFSCTNDGNLTVIFADYSVGDGYEKVARTYFDAAPPAQPEGREKAPPSGLHVFAWSPTQRAVVWTDAESRLIGVAVTSSRETDLVELWSRYRPS